MEAVIKDGSNTATVSLTQLFEHECPFFMSIGMSYQEFWEQDVTLCTYYRKANEIRKDRVNEELHLAGFYNFIAISSAFASEKERQKYIENPIPRTQEQADKQEEEKQHRQMERIKARFMVEKKDREAKHGR